MNANVLRRLDELGDWREVLERVVTDIFVHRRTRRQRSSWRHQNGVAVGISARDELGANAAPGAAATVLDHDTLAEHSAEPIRNDACHTIGRSARRERHDHLDRPVRIGFGL